MRLFRDEILGHRRRCLAGSDPSVTLHENTPGTELAGYFFFFGGTVRVNSMALVSHPSTASSSAATSGGRTT